MRGLALEGGGARGAYHIGVMKAFTERGYKFDGFVGTSIGAVNAAALAQGDFEKSLELWMTISMEQVFDPEELRILQLADTKGQKPGTDLPFSVKKSLTKVINGRGVSTEKMKAFLNGYINEDRIRKSGKDFGLVTFSLSDRKPHELMLEDIPQGQLVNYIMASASFPGFRPETIDGKMFLDGGIYNNCPVNLLLDRNYDEVIAVRTKTPGIRRRVEDSKRVKYITPKDDLGRIMLFSPERSKTNIKIGYCDGLRHIDNLRGDAYYIRPVDVNVFNARLMALKDETIHETGRVLGVPEMDAKRMLFEKIIPLLSTYLKLDSAYDYADFFIALLEHTAKQREIERYRIYEYDRLCTLARETSVTAKQRRILDRLPVGNIYEKKREATELLIANLLIKKS